MEVDLGLLTSVILGVNTLVCLSIPFPPWRCLSGVVPLWIISVPPPGCGSRVWYLGGRTLRSDSLGVRGLMLDTLYLVSVTGRFDTPVPVDLETPGLGMGSQVSRLVVGLS